MCELLGMSANVPTDICFSFSGLIQRGGRTGPHRDGWGIAFYQGRGVREFRDAMPGAESEIARLVERYPIKSDIVIAHIRQANSGRVCLENTHPFLRELWGRHWTFAHNGQLKGLRKLDPPRFYRPVGTSDSERAFCWMLDRLREQFPESPRSRAQLRKFLYQLAETLRGHGVFNLLLSDSRALYAYCSTKLCWITRKAPFGQASLEDAEMCVDFGAETTPRDVVSVVATTPLTSDEHWQIMQRAEMQVFENGCPVQRLVSGLHKGAA